MFKDMLLLVKYPYASGINTIIWLGTGLLIVINNSLPVLTIVTINMIATLIVTYVGFKVEKRA